MVFNAIAPALGGIASAIGGIIGSNKDAEAQAGVNKTNRRIAKKNIRLQKQFARKGVTWKVRDTMRIAKRKKMHPLALLGQQTHSFSPVSAGQQAYTGRSAAYANAGADLGAAAASMAPSAIQQRQQDSIIAGLSIERAGLENQLLKTQIASELRRALQPSRGPGIGNTDSNNQDVAFSNYQTAGGDPMHSKNVALPGNFQLDEVLTKWALDGTLGSNLEHLIRLNFPAAANKWLDTRAGKVAEEKKYTPPPVRKGGRVQRQSDNLYYLD